MRYQMRARPHLLVGLAGVVAVCGVLLLTPRVEFPDLDQGPGRGETLRAFGTTTVGQTMIPRRDGLTAVSLATNLLPNPDVEVVFRLRRLEDGASLRVLRGPAGEFLDPDGQVLRFAFPPLSGTKDTALAFTLAAPRASPADAIPLRYEVASELYPDGALLQNEQPQRGDAGFQTTVRGTTADSWRHRLLVDNAGQWFAGIGLAVLGGLILLDAMSVARRPAPSRHRQLRLILWSSLALALLYTFPLYAHVGRWADDESDWPEVVSYFAATRHALTAGQFPGWNPYVCGGAPHFANPQAFFMALPLPFALLFGDIVGPKIALTLVIALGLVGATLLAGTLGLRSASAALPGIVFLFSGFTTTHLANGQLLWLTLAWIPWIVLGFLRALSNPWWSLVAAGFLTLTFVEGRLYLVAYAALLLTLLAGSVALQRRPSTTSGTGQPVGELPTVPTDTPRGSRAPPVVLRRSFRPLAILALIGTLTLLGSAWKLLPALAFLADTQSSLGNANGISFRVLPEAFLRRDVTPNITDRTQGLDLPRHEYAAYVGILPLLLALFSVRRETRARALPFLLSGAAFLVLATQNPETSLLELLPLTRELRNPSRMLSMVVFNVAILSGFGLQVLTRVLPRLRVPRLRSLLPSVVTLVILGDLLAVGWTHLAPLFRRPPSSITFDHPGFFQTRLPVERQVNNGYPTVAAGHGAKDFCPVVLRAYRPHHNVLPREDARYRGEVHAEGRSRVALTSFTPNALEIAVEASEPDTIVVNQQYDRGWSARPFLTRNHDTLLAVDVPPGSHTVHLRYRTPLLGIGSFISLALIVGVGVLWRFPSSVRSTFTPLRAWSRRFRWRAAPMIVAAATILAAGLLVTAPPQPFWGERHLAHLEKPPFPLPSGHSVRQTFHWEADTLDLAVLWIDVRAPRPSDGELLLTVETPFGARTATASFADIPPSGAVLFPLKPALRGQAGGDGTLSVRLAHDGQNVSLQYQIASGFYPQGTLALEGVEKQGDLAFQLRYQQPALRSRGLQWGYALALLAAGLTVAAAVARRPAHIAARSVAGGPLRATARWFSRRDLVLALAAAIVVGGVYHRALLGRGFWVGASDFSKDAAYLASAGEALDRGVWPIWSHRTCGGMLLLGNPEGNTISLGTLLATALHADQALLTLLVIEAGLAAAGTFLLARALRLSTGASIAAAAVASLSASFPYRIIEGLTPVGGAVAFTSWALLALFRALETSQGPAAIVSGTLLAAMFFRGDIHIVVGVLFVVAAIALTVALRRRSRTPLLLLGVIGATFFFWSSVKLLPYLEQPSLVGGNLPPYVAPLTRMGLLDDALVRLHDRSYDTQPLHDRRSERWGNFGGYVGVLPLVLAGIGLFHRHRFRAVVVTGTVLAFLLSEGELFEVVLRHVGPLGVLLRMPTRLFSLFAVFLALLAGSGIDRLRRHFSPWLRRAVTAALLALLFLDLEQATTGLFGRNLEWSGGRTLPSPSGPTLVAHRNVSPNHELHATKLLHAGYLLPRICGDQNNPPPFVTEVRDAVPLTTVRSQLFPNRILLDAPSGPSDIVVRERFVSSWRATKGAVLQHDDGALHVVLPKMEAGPVELRYGDPLAATQKILLALFLIQPLLLVRRSRERRAADDSASTPNTLSAPDPIVASTDLGDSERFVVRMILPAYNEAENLPTLVRDIATALGSIPYRIYAVNDGSRDATLAALRHLATRFPITVLDHAVNKGVAAAFRTGFAAVLTDATDDDVVVLMEGDGTSTPSLLPEMVRRIRAGADVVIASRYRPGGGYRNFPVKRLVLSRGANAIFRLLFPISGVTDYSIFYRAYRVPPLRAVTAALGDRFIESTTFLANAEILVKLRPSVRRVEEIPLLYDYGKKKGRTGMKVWKNLWSYLVFLARHLRQRHG